MEFITPHPPIPMSEEQLKAFQEAVQADAGLQEKLKAAAYADAVAEIAKAAGFVISAEELKKAHVEISDEELDGVAGGNVGVEVAAGRKNLEALETPLYISGLPDK